MTEQEINNIVSENLNYVKAVANEYKGRGLAFEDLVSEGSLAMLMAARKFDPGRGVPFVSYAGPFIRKSMKTAVDKQAGVYRLPKDAKKVAPKNADKAVSVDAPLSAGNQYTLLDVLTNKDYDAPEDLLTIERMKQEILNQMVYLDEREKEVIKKFYGINAHNETLAEIGLDMGLKRERVRQIRDKAMRKLNKYVHHKALSSLLKK